MHPAIKRAARESTDSKINFDIMCGLPHTEIDRTLEIHRELATAAFPSDNNGLVFKSIVRCSPDEVVWALKKGKLCTAAAKEYDLAETTMFLAKVAFSYEGLDFTERYLYIPYLKPGSMMYIAGSLYAVKPSLTDKTISPNDDNKEVCIRLLKTVAKVGKLEYGINVNTRTITITTNHMVDLVRRRSNYVSYTPANATLLHYLLAKYGYAVAMQMVLGFVPEVITAEEALTRQHTAEGHQEVIYSSKGVAPRTRVRTPWEPPNVALVIPASARTTISDNVCGTFIYIVDHFHTVTIDTLEDKRMWTHYLGYILYGKQNILDLQPLVKGHLTALDSYVPPIVQQRIYEEFGDYLDQDFSVDGFFKLLVVTMQRFDIWVISASDISASPYDKRLTAMYLLFKPFMLSINELAFQIAGQQNNPPSMKSMSTLCNKAITPKKAYSLRKMKDVVSPISYSGDHKYFKITGPIDLQLNITGHKSRNAKSVTAITLLDESQCIGGTMSGITKSRLSPLSFINIFAPYHPPTRTLLPSRKVVNSTKSLRGVLRNTSRLSSRTILPKEYRVYECLEEYEEKNGISKE